MTNGNVINGVRVSSRAAMLLGMDDHTDAAIRVYAPKGLCGQSVRDTMRLFNAMQNANVLYYESGGTSVTRAPEDDVARIAAKDPAVAALLADGIVVTLCHVSESSDEHVQVGLVIELAADRRWWDADGRPQGTWIWVHREYSKPVWRHDEPRALIEFDHWETSITSRDGDDLPCLLSDAEWTLIDALTRPMAEREIEAVRDKTFDWEE